MSILRNLFRPNLRALSSLDTDINQRLDSELGCNRDLVPLDLGSFRLFTDRADVAVSVQIAATGDYETPLSGFLRRVVKPGMTAVDIGANIGFYTMLFASLVGEAGRVLAFEPNSENCRILLLSIEANNFRQVTLFPFALAEEMAALYFTPSIGSNGLVLPGRKGTLLDPNCVVVPSMRLDAIESGQVHVIKADIEGAEYRALRGAEAIIRRCRPIGLRCKDYDGASVTHSWFGFQA